MIILEGADCTGKTTLANKLIEHFDLDKNFTHYSEHKPETMLNHAKTSLPGIEEIVDRFHLSEIPYSMYHRHETPDYDSVADIGLELRDGINMIIVCVPPWVQVAKFWGERKDEELIKNMIVLRNIYQWYRLKSQAFSPQPVWKYDYTMVSDKDLFNTITDWVVDYNGG